MCFTTGMAFLAERWRLKRHLERGEKVMASDPVFAAGQRRSERTTLVVSDRALYVLQDRATRRVPFAEIAGVNSRARIEGIAADQIIISLRDGSTSTYTYGLARAGSHTLDVLGTLVSANEAVEGRGHPVRTEDTTTFSWTEIEAVLSVIAAAEEPGGAECDNAAIVEVTGFDPVTVAEILGQLWAADQIEGLKVLGAAPSEHGVNLQGIRRVLPDRDRLWGSEGRYHR